MQALMLAAGMGKRLAKYTQNNTKCMVPVAGKKLIDRAIESLKIAGINRFVIVIGYKGENLKKYILENHKGEMDFVFIENKDYATTNNIYSFYLAKDELIKDDTILMESDVIYEPDLIKKMVEYKHQNIAAVAKYESWMDGTVVEADDDHNITSFIEKKDMDNNKLDRYFKTVNIYKFSVPFVRDVYIPFLEAYMKAYGMNSYYETTLKVLCMLKDFPVKAFYMRDIDWYEIDDAQDLSIATALFTKGIEKYNFITSAFGGFWRYTKVKDFCYLVNPYFPPKRLVEKMQNEFAILLTQYPSGENVQNMNAERLFGVDKEHILVGNGAAELINALGHVARGTIAVNLPAFNEYVRCFKNCVIHEIDNSKIDYKMDVKTIEKAVRECDYTAVINPDNPSGFMLDKEQIFAFANIAKEAGHKLIIDESFVDFADGKRRFTLLDDKFISENPNVIVIKSISKSYGVPGIRLGLLATSDTALIKALRDDMQIWNINSFGEYYLQIYQLFAKDYEKACDAIVNERNRVIAELRKLKSIRVYDSEANYILVDLKENNSIELAAKLLDEKHILIKDLSTKNYFHKKNFIRLAIRDENDNNALIEALNEYLK
jgi:histidinol-phosphate/aromatic aminotransferase/cobyric acid decarboxylase-like protein/GTP:adenosylcobinamide-phosphate guanylyltransferase